MLDEVIADLEQDESWRPHPYQDHLGNWTIGFGFLIDGRKPVTLPREVGNHWLRYLVERRYEDLLSEWESFEEQPKEVQRALVNMSYQLGINGVLKFKRMIAALEGGDRELAAIEAMDSEWAQQTPKRAKRIAALIRGHE